MHSSTDQREPALEYLSCVERAEELDRLRSRAKTQKSLLVFGPEGVGKSRLLRAFVESQPACTLCSADELAARVSSRPAPIIASRRRGNQDSRKHLGTVVIIAKGHRAPGA